MTTRRIGHIVSASSLLRQMAEAERIGNMYKHRLLERGFRFGFDGESCFPPEGMHYKEAMNISNQIWAEVNESAIR